MYMNYSGTVLVAGATGRTGQRIVKSLQLRGIAYRLFVRSREKACSLFDDTVAEQCVTGSAESPDDVRRAVEGIDAVICAIGGAVTDPQAAPPSAIDRDAVIRLASMARQSGVKQFILISSLAVTKPDHPLNKYGRVLDMKLEGENGVRELFHKEGLGFTIIRPGGLLDGPPLQHRLLLDTGDRITGSIDRSDVAEIAVLSLTAPSAWNRTFELIRAEEARQESLDHFFGMLS
ncbi:MAG: SDR family oxidoreductase [Chlorobium sp.]|uniref:SDR family oxidoreductase n=1 Tax=Chlorobium sp. TaxID=1095 RepID=UPI0025BB319F|nr:SDR family oxidoreductase [Chlorobium sp.]MCF8216869.1 SDR family oxidoreductase [Chlorobium sp.]MCF8270451.1 SDR family oxidoreductase [Chlorobium sp.]MCF8288086.1 SDR family oxidoreductase [Chlorobium sp.]MCF8290419.1 SDR family oxidoreductase [Chlorobium sp.]MCF8384653.1 SDR family oxidoreductase [Chlorobium sp.]